MTGITVVDSYDAHQQVTSNKMSLTTFSEEIVHVVLKIHSEQTEDI